MDITIISQKMFPLADNFSQPDAARLWGIGEVLKNFKFDVTYLFPETINFPSFVESYNSVFFYNDSNLNKVLKKINPSCVLISEWEIAEKINRKQLPVIFDLSSMDIVDSTHSTDISLQLRKIEALRKCDLFICSTEKQKWFFMSLLLQSGFDVSGNIIHIIPPVFPKEAFIFKDENIDISGRVYLTYFDSSNIVDFKSIDQIIEVLKTDNHILEFIIGSDSFQSGLDNYLFLSENLDKFSNNLSFNEIFSWYEMIREFRSASVGVSLYETSLENQMRFAVEGALYLCCGLPVICDRNSGLANLVGKYKAGWVVDTDNPLKLTELIKKIQKSPEEIKRKSENAVKLASSVFLNSEFLKPLVEFCREPHKRTVINTGLVGHMMEYSNKVLNMNNPLLNDIYIEDILIFHSSSWDQLIQCLESIDVMFPMTNITIIALRHHMIEDIDLISDCNLIVCNTDEFESDSIKETLLLSNNYKFDLGVALFDNHYGEGYLDVKNSLIECGAKYKAGFTADQNFVIIEDSIEKCITEVLQEFDELPLNDSIKSTGSK